MLKAAASGGYLKNAYPVSGSPRDYDALIRFLGEASLVLLGEATRGTHEFYRERAALTRRLITEEGFAAVAVDADWPDAARVDRYVRGQSSDPHAKDALAGFHRFPAWTWRNSDVLNFVNWLRAFNSDKKPQERVGFYGLDLYGLYGSIGAALSFLDRTDPAAARRARDHYSRAERFNRDPPSYVAAVQSGWIESCKGEIAKLFLERRQDPGRPKRGTGKDRDEEFYADRKAELLQSEADYRQVLAEGPSGSLRIRQMAETLTALISHLSRTGRNAKIVVWDHNSRLGDARATEMGEKGESSLGQRVRILHPRGCFLIGLTTYEGTVAAASRWEGPVEVLRVNPALFESFEQILHEFKGPDFFMILREDPGLLREFGRRRLERAIGAVYLPERERDNHYFEANLARQFDAVIHLDQTHAVLPLEAPSILRRRKP